MTQNIRLTQAKWVLGEISTDSWPTLAADLLEQGYDTSSLRRLSAFVAPTWFEIHELVDELFRELGLTAISRQTAWLRLARSVASQVAEGRIDAGTGAGQLAHLGLDAPYQQHAARYAEPC